MITTKCLICYGSGQMIGGGMIKKACDNCDGNGFIKELLPKGSEAYLSTKEKIKQVDQSITDQEAEKILDDELKKQKRKK